MENNMGYNLFIDDERVPSDVTWAKSLTEQYMYKVHDWVIARNWYEVEDIILTFGMPVMISFDHDLGENERTGYEIAQRISEMVMDGIEELPENFSFMVHSKNPVGAENIYEYMNNFIEHWGK
jgi:hypothetical protein